MDTKKPVNGPDDTRGFPVEMTLYLTDEELAAVRAEANAADRISDLDAVARFASGALHRAITAAVRAQRASAEPSEVQP
jgi:hypothetical protein